MAVNSKPVFAGAPVVGKVAALTAANTSYDGTGTASLLFTAGADGAYIDRIMVRAKGTNVATVIRLFLVTGADNTTASNNTLIDEIGLLATTAIQTAALTPFYFTNAMGLRLLASEKLYVTVGTGVAGGLSVTAFCGSLTAI